MDVLGWNRDEIECLDDDEYERRLETLVKESIERDPVEPGYIPFFVGGTRWKMRHDIEALSFESTLGKSFPLEDGVRKCLERDGAVVWDLTFDALLMLVLWHHGCGFPSLADEFPPHPHVRGIPIKLPFRKLDCTKDAGTVYHEEDPEEPPETRSESIHVSAQAMYSALSPEELRLLEGPNTGTGVAADYMRTLADYPAQKSRVHPFFDREGSEPADILGRSKRAPLDLLNPDFNLDTRTDLSLIESTDELIGDRELAGESIQLGLLRILLLAGEMGCDELWNDAMDAFRLGEAALRRPGVMLYHIKCVFGSGTYFNHSDDYDDDDNLGNDHGDCHRLLKGFFVDCLLYYRALYRTGITESLNAFPAAYEMVTERLASHRPVPGVMSHGFLADIDAGPMSAACSYHKHGGKGIVLSRSCPSNCSVRTHLRSAIGPKRTGNKRGRKRAEAIPQLEMRGSPSVCMTDAPSFDDAGPLVDTPSEEGASLATPEAQPQACSDFDNNNPAEDILIQVPRVARAKDNTNCVIVKRVLRSRHAVPKRFR